VLLSGREKKENFTNLFAAIKIARGGESFRRGGQVSEEQ